MAKVEKTVSPFDWNYFITTLSKVINEPDARDMLYNYARNERKKEIQNFRDEFISKAREFSYKSERQEYYTENNISEEDQRSIENTPLFSEIRDDLYEIEYLYLIEKLFKDMNHWFYANQKSMRLTQVWFFSLGRQSTYHEFPTIDKLYLLIISIKYDIINSELAEMPKGGERLSKLLSVIMDCSPGTIAEELPRLKTYFDFRELSNDKKGTKEVDTEKILDMNMSQAGRWRSNLDSLVKFIEGLQKGPFSKDNPNLKKKYYDLSEYFDTLQSDLKRYFPGRFE
jgi:hypothetical protein